MMSRRVKRLIYPVHGITEAISPVQMLGNSHVGAPHLGIYITLAFILPRDLFGQGVLTDRPMDDLILV